MYINYQQLTRLPVVTESGKKLGHVHDVEIDVESHHIRKYIVGQGFLSKDTYLVAPSQIIEITKDKIIVEDNIMKAADLEPKKGVIPPALDAPFTMDRGKK